MGGRTVGDTGPADDEPFAVTALAYLALFLLGWRALAMVGSHLWRKSHSYAQRG